MEDKKAEYQNRHIPSRAKELSEITEGPAPNLVVHYDTFNPTALNVLDSQGLHQIAMAYRTLAMEKKGKEALQQVNAIEIWQASSPRVELRKAEGSHYTLHLHGAFGSNTLNDRDIAHCLEENLQIKLRSVTVVLKEEQLPSMRKEAIQILGGGDFDWEPEWDSLTTIGSIHYLADVCCHRILMAFRSICDGYGAAGQTALRERILKARFRNTTSSQERNVSVEGMTLVLHQLIDRTHSGESINIITHDEIEAAIVAALGMKKFQNLSKLQDQLIPERNKELQEIWGGEASSSPSYRVDWDSFTSDSELNYVENVSCQRVAMALRGLDKKSFEALKQKGLSSILLRNTTDTSKTLINMEAAGAVLSMTCCYSAGLSGAFSDGIIRNTLKKYATS